MLRSHLSWLYPVFSSYIILGIFSLLPLNSIHSQDCLGNYVFYDANNDGIQDATDVPYAGVRVWVYNETTPGNFVVIGQTVTDGAGLYNFTNANTLFNGTAGVKYVVIEDVLTEPGNLNPVIPTTLNVGFDDAIDSDGSYATFGPFIGKPMAFLVHGPIVDNKDLDFGFYTICADIDVTLPVSMNVCENEAVLITADADDGGNGPLVYEWSDGTFTSTNTTNYVTSVSEPFGVTVTDTNGCSAEAETQLIVERCEFDLSLTKSCPSDITAVYAGDTYTFELEICNEGESALDSVEIYDYLPSGYNLVAGGGWNVVTATTALTTLSLEISRSNGLLPATGLLAGECITFPMETRIDDCATFGNLDNVALIHFQKDVAGFQEDVDSTPGTVIADEDDTDNCTAPIFDLALRKTLLTAASPLQVGDIITYQIEIFNQGSIDADEVQIIDYIPGGIELTTNNPNWVLDAATSTATGVITTPIPPGGSEIITIEFELIGGKGMNDFTNYAEILSAKNGDVFFTRDFDSTYDNDVSNDAGGVPNFDSDDWITDNGSDKDGDGVRDEDDHDPDMLEIFDLALTKKVVSLPPYSYGGNIAFEIEVCNQGTIVATNVVVRDILPPGFTFNTALAGAWSLVGGNPETTIPNQIAEGECESVVINLLLGQKLVDGDLNNYATIVSAQDNLGNDMTGNDFDSTPGTHAAHESSVSPGSDDDDNVCGRGPALGEDEDDHDVASVDIVDVALSKVETTSGPYQYGDQVCYEIEIFNQGSVDIATAKIIDTYGAGLIPVAASFPTWNQGPNPLSITHDVKNLPSCSSTTVDICFTLTKTDLVGATNFDNCAEIYYLEDSEWNDLTDIDSNLDTNPFNDAGGAVGSPADNYILGDGTGLVGGTVAAGDEDDHDCERIQIIDLALRKTANVVSCAYGDIVTFTIEVFNQGNVAVTDVAVVDYLPSGLVFDPANNPAFAWTNTATPTYTIPAIAVGASETITINLELIQTGGGLKDWTNYAEILSFADAAGVDISASDADSFAGSNGAEENTVCEGDDNDNEINECGGLIFGEDEDDHDPAGIRVVDLALSKTVLTPGPYLPGGNVVFEIEVFNQGNVTVENVVVFDNFPSGMTFGPGNFPTWNFDPFSGNAAAVLNSIIYPGQSRTVQISAVLGCVESGQYLTGWDNCAEIFAFQDENGNYITTEDKDSTADAVSTNDAGGQVFSAADNFVDGDGTGSIGDGVAATDEDDHDCERLPIFDLALKKEVFTTAPYVYGQDVQFNITVCNQGNIIANNIDVTDYIPAGFALNAGGSPGWTPNGTDAVFTISTPLAPDACTVIPIELTVLPKSGDAKDWTNYAEITAAQDDAGVDMSAQDYDSTPASNSLSENALLPGDADDDNMLGKGPILGEDEDDHDVAGIEIVDVALRKTEATGGPYNYGDLVCFDIEIINQGNVDIASVGVVDYFPAGFTLNSANSPDWQAVSNSNTATYKSKTLPACETLVTQICFTIVKSEGGVTDWDNCAEINYLEDANWNNLIDVDSTPDSINGNDAGGAVNTAADNHVDGDGTGAVNDGVASTDEDDHDCERIEVFDLALRKTVNVATCDYGDKVTFTIEVFNQGNAAVQNVLIEDYFPTGLLFNAADNPTWNANATQLMAGPIMPGTSASTTVVLEVLQTAGGAKDWTNYAEIISFMDMSGTDQSAFDIDSSPASNSTIENNVCEGDDFDNVIDGCGPSVGEDEDDHDPAGIRVVDLALRKTVLTSGPYVPGMNVFFEIEVFNQGNVTVDEVVVFDKLPGGMTFSSTNFPTWSHDALTGNATTTINSPILPGASHTVQMGVVLSCVESGSTLTGWDNYAEIFSFEDEFDTNISTEDKDSTPDAITTNDAGGLVFSAADNYIDGDGTGAIGDGVAATDEDDHDCERLEIFDLALKKEVFTAAPYSYGQSVQFNLMVCNQGNITANNIEITDYIPAGFALNAAGSPGWTLSGSDAVFELTTPLAPDQCVNFQIQLTVLRKSGDAKDWTNYAEITYAEDATGVDMTDQDWDSTPGSNSLAENALLPGDADDDNMLGKGPLFGEDEDDHDVAGIEIVDVALTKTIATIGALSYGDEVCFDIEIINQGNVDIASVGVIDYFPAGFTLNSVSSPDWQAVSNSNTATYKSKTLAACTSEVVQICFEIAKSDGGFTDWDNCAEINYLEDSNWNALVDIDSTPDSFNGNDAGGAVDSAADNYVDGDASGVVGGSVAAGDEDDHDCERVVIYDLALRKTTPIVTCDYGDKVPFTIEVFNQGNVPVQNILVEDYFPAGLVFNNADNPSWNANGTYLFGAPILPGASATVTIILELVQTSGGVKDFTNFAEIISFTDLSGVDQSANDADSTPGSNSALENAVCQGDPDDDEINECGTVLGEDEDDHDPAGLRVVDLALKKTTTAAGPFRPGDLVNYEIMVCNQGNVLVDEVQVFDHIPSGLAFDASNFPFWIYDSVSRNAVATFVDPIVPGTCTTMDILLEVQCSDNVDYETSWDNIAEIYSFEDDQDNNITAEDKDSNADAIFNNDAGGHPWCATDDYIDGDGTGVNYDCVAETDEDDHDPERIEIFDLALKKELITFQDPYKYGQLLQFDITVCNQGNIGAQDVVIQDYLPAGFNFNPALNPGWSSFGTDAQYTIPAIAVNTCEVVSINLTIVQTNGGEKDWVNYSEIISAFNENGEDRTTWDFDSTPGSDNITENQVEPDHAGDNDMLSKDMGGEEDDHDPAGIELLDLAVRKTTVNQFGPFCYGDQIIYTIEICNQGSIQAEGVQLTDYIPCGFVYDTFNDILFWSYNPLNGNATRDFVGTLDAGQCVTTNIFVNLQQCIDNDINTFTNFVEISNGVSTDPDYPDILDVDSCSDIIEGNDLGGTPDDPTEDNIMTGDKCAGEDEDDHDPERVEVFDLALIQQLITINDPYKYGQLLQFDMTVCNQGNVDASNIVVENYLPVGFSFNAANNPGWANNGGVLTYDIPGDLIQDQCVTFPIYLTIEQTTGGEKDWVNYAEIISSTDLNNVVRKDADSNPASNTTEENLVEPDHAGDDDIESVDRGGEEDDHDPAGIELLDLALRKTTVNQYGPFCYGDQIVYNIEICNQGSIQAESIQLTDYIPCGFEYDALNDQIAWSYDSATGDATMNIAQTLDPGQCMNRTIYVNLQQCIDNDINTFTNFVEISRGLSTDPDYPNILDVDSCSDALDNNDLGGTPDNVFEDDVITGDKCAFEDEDDHDPERVQIFDLALKKELITVNNPYKYGQLLQFDITVCNQGNLDAMNIAVQEYLPAGYSFDVANNPGWLFLGGIPVYVIPTTLIQDQCTTFPVYLTIEQTTGGEKDWVNYAEIIYATDINGVVRKDADSNPASNSVTENLVEPDHAGDDNLESVDRGGEEDDHDPAGIELLDLALRKTIVSQGPYKIKSEIEFEIEIFNQGSVEANNINIVDYVPCGLVYNDDSSANGWIDIAAANQAYYIHPQTLQPGQSFTTRVKFDIRKCDGACVDDWLNYAEIASARSTDPDYLFIRDVDSNTDLIANNDLGGNYDNPAENNVITGDSCAGEDEDDHDPELVPVYDLALQKRSTYNGIDSIGPFVPGDIVEFHIEVHNQGSLDAINTQITDYLNYGFSFNPGINPGWVQTGGLIQYFIPDAISPCDSRLVKLNLEIISPANAMLGDWYNEAEISSGTDASGTIDCDADSTPDTNPDNDNDLVDGPDDDPVFNFGDNNDEVIDEHIGDPCDRGDDDEDDNDAAEVIVVGDLCGFVWEDCNGDGIRNDLNRGIEGVEVQAFDENGVFVGSAFTNASGLYTIEDLIPANYFIKVIKPEDWLVTFFRQGLFLNLDSDINDSNGECTSPLAYLGGGSCDPGNYDVGLFKCIPVGESVWYDINQNSLMDANENGINGLPVNIYRFMNGQYDLWASTVTGHKPGTPSDDGYYKFCVPPGTYYLEIDIPEFGLVLNQKNVGANGFLNYIHPSESGIDNDFNFNGASDVFTINCDIEELCNIGAGFFPMSQVGSRVWMDTDKDGMRSAGETGVSGVLVEAYDSNNTFINSDVTDASGNYKIDYLGMDDYYLKLYPPNTMGVTTLDAGNDDNMDSDFGSIYGPNTTNLISLAPGDDVNNVDGGLIEGVVPVEWKYIVAEARDEHNIVRWETASERNVSHFEVERSLVNVNDFIKIGENVKSDSPINGQVYNLNDLDVSTNGKYYYRVKQVDLNGAHSYSDIVSVTREEEKVDLSIYPNPTSEQVNISFNLDEDQLVEIDLLDAKGRIAQKAMYLNELAKGAHKLSLNINHIPSGSYTITISINGDLIHKKLMIL